MTPAEHCPRCLRSDAHAWGQQQTGEETVTTWACQACRHRWSTSYLTAAYADQGDEDGYWEDPDRWSEWDPRTGW